MNKQEIEKAVRVLRNVTVGSRLIMYSVNVAISCMEQQLNNGWIPVDSKPDSDRPVEVTARRKTGARGYFVLKACYVAPHTQTTEDYGWDIGNVDGEYDEEKDCYWIPECWYEDNAISDNENWILNDEYDILAWRELPESWKPIQPTTGIS
jgi:hypothetical protein